MYSFIFIEHYTTNTFPFDTSMDFLQSSTPKIITYLQLHHHSQVPAPLCWTSWWWWTPHPVRWPKRSTATPFCRGPVRRWGFTSP